MGPRLFIAYRQAGRWRRLAWVAMERSVGANNRSRLSAVGRPDLSAPARQGLALEMHAGQAGSVAGRG